MLRKITAIIFLILLIILFIFWENYRTSNINKIIEKIDAMEQLIEKDDTNELMTAFYDLKETWKEHEEIFKVFSLHSFSDDFYNLLSDMEAEIIYKEPFHLKSTLNEIREHIQNYKESEQLSIYNLF